MKKKLLYGIFFISIFLLSSASMVQPVHGYEFGVPDAAVGRDSEAEITIFDEDEYEAHFGKDSDMEAQGWEGDWDEVGAKTKSHYLEIEDKSDDEGIKYLKDHSWKRSIIPGNARARNAVNSLWNPAFTGDYGPLMQYYNSTAAGAIGSGLLSGDNLTSMQALYGNIQPALGDIYIYNAGEGFTDVINAPGYGKKFDGTYLIRDWWYYTDEAYDEDADEEDYDIPFLADPRDFKTAWDYTYNLGLLQRQNIADLDAAWQPAAPLIGPSPSQATLEAYGLWNASIAGAFPAALLAALANFGAVGNLYYSQPAFAIDYVFGLWYFSSYIMGATAASIEFGYPSKAGYLLSVLLANQPMYIPQADYIAKLVEKFYIDDEDLVKMPGCISQSYVVGTSTVYYPVYAYVDIYTEGVAIIAEIEYPDNTYDPADLVDGEADPDELEDFEIVFVYSDTGGPSKIQFKDGDEVFWEQSAISAIPGYEIHILLGASAISVFGLIYVIMKKRKM